MSKRTCKDCRNRFSDEGTCPVRFGVSDTDDATNCDTFEPITIFDRITTSPEVLAEKLVYPKGEKLCCIGTDNRYEYKMMWGSVLLPGITFKEYAEAYLSTVAKLEEVARENG